MMENIFIQLLEGKIDLKPRKKSFCPISYVKKCPCYLIYQIPECRYNNIHCPVEKVYEGCPKLRCPYFAEIPQCGYFYCISGYINCENCPHWDEEFGCQFDFPVFLYENEECWSFSRRKVKELIELINGKYVNKIEKHKEEAEKFIEKLEKAEIIKYY